MLSFVVQWLIPIALAIFAWVDCLLTPRPYVRLLPKPVWAVLIAVPYFGALMWIVGGRVAQPHDPRRRSTDFGGADTAGGRFGAFSRGTHQARPRLLDSRGRGPRDGADPGTWAVPPDDDPEFLRKLGEQLKKDRPES